MTSRSSDQNSIGPKFGSALPGSTAIRPCLHRLVPPPSDHACTIRCHRPQTRLVPSGSIDLRPRLHHPVPPPSDHACTIRYHCHQTRLAPSGSIALRPRLHHPVPPPSLRPRLQRLILPPSDHSCNVWSHRTKADGAAASTYTKCQSNRFAADMLVPHSSSISHEAVIISFISSC